MVKDQNRVNESATPEEKAGSDQMKEAHGEEIAKYAEAHGGVPSTCIGNAGAAVNGASNVATNGECSMNASTGVAELSPGLVALLILSIVGAAGHAFSRRGTV